MRHDLQLLRDMVDFSQEVINHVGDVTEEQFLSDDVLHSAVMYKLIVIGEAASALSDEFCEKFPDPPWRKIVGFRNRAIHGYFATDWEIVYDVAVNATRSLHDELKQIIQTIE